MNSLRNLVLRITTSRRSKPGLNNKDSRSMAYLAVRIEFNFSGTASQAENAFNTEFHSYKSGDRTAYGPSTDLSIPAALSSIVQTVGNISSFHPKSFVKFRARRKPSLLPVNPAVTICNQETKPLSMMSKSIAQPTQGLDNRSPSSVSLRFPCRTSRTFRVPQICQVIAQIPPDY